jgi:hypothetical protein
MSYPVGPLASLLVHGTIHLLILEFYDTNLVLETSDKIPYPKGMTT